MPRARIQIRWIMLAIAVLAVLLALPIPIHLLLLVPLTIVSSMILVAAWLAPRDLKLQAAYWAAALHPLVLLAWLAAWRFVLDPRTLYPMNRGWYFTLVLWLPYFLAWSTRWYLPSLIGLLGMVAPRFDDRLPREALAIPLLAATVVGFLTFAVLVCDPFKMAGWFWD